MVPDGALDVDDAAPSAAISMGTTRIPLTAKSIAFAGAIVFAATALLFARTIRFGFVSWDDGRYVYENTHLASASFADLVRWALTDTPVGLWVPMTLLTLGVDYVISGGAPWSFHLTNTVLHAANAVLVFALALRLLRRAEGTGRRELAVAIGAALLFALHPLRVESVAWVTERKDVLCGFFSLLATHAYVSYARSVNHRSHRGAYAASVIFLVLALVSKPAAVAVPVAWLALDAFPLRRLDGAPGRRIAEKAPHLAAALAMAVVTSSVSQGVVTPQGVPFALRLLMVAGAPLSSVRLMVWPAGLRPMYSHAFGADAFAFGRVTAAAVALAVTGAALLRWRRPGPLGAAWVAFVVLLAPSTGVVVAQIGAQEIADRFTYLPAVPLSLLAGAAVHEAMRRKPIIAAAAVAGSMVVVIALAALSFRQMEHWVDGFAMWDRVLRYERGLGVAWNGRSIEYEQRGNFPAALADLERAIQIAEERPWSPLATLYRRRAGLLDVLGHPDLAEADEARAAKVERERGHDAAAR